MGKNNLMQKMMAMCREAFADGQRVGQQQTFDAVMIYLHRNGWGTQRILKLHAGTNGVMEEYAPAFFAGMEQDINQERMDRELRDALKGAEGFCAFAERYPEVKTVGYDKLPKTK